MAESPLPPAPVLTMLPRVARLSRPQTMTSPPMYSSGPDVDEVPYSTYQKVGQSRAAAVGVQVAYSWPFSRQLQAMGQEHAPKEHEGASRCYFELPWGLWTCDGDKPIKTSVHCQASQTKIDDAKAVKRAALDHSISARRPISGTTCAKRALLVLSLRDKVSKLLVWPALTRSIATVIRTRVTSSVIGHAIW